MYNQMLEDEVVPDGMTFHLASRAHVMLVRFQTLCCRGNHNHPPGHRGGTGRGRVSLPAVSGTGTKTREQVLCHSGQDPPLPGSPTPLPHPLLTQ